LGYQVVQGRGITGRNHLLEVSFGKDLKETVFKAGSWDHWGIMGLLV